MNRLTKEFGTFYPIPEGGANHEGYKGCVEITKDLNRNFDFVCCPVGTGTTMAGLIAGLANKAFVIGFNVLKGADNLKKPIRDLLNEANMGHYTQWELINDYHFGGYAKFNKTLIDFVNQFKAAYGIALDPVYTGKMMAGLKDLIENDYFPEHSKILAIHTGGLQGITGFNQRFGNWLK